MKNASPELPVGLAEPLHFIEPAGSSALLVWISLLAFLFILFWWWRRRKKPSPAPPLTNTTATPVATKDRSIVQAIEDLRTRTGRSKQYRQGCHRLAATLRQHFNPLSERDLSILTAREIADALKNPTVGTVFSLLAELQFRRREPRYADFDQICDLAVETVRSKR